MNVETNPNLPWLQTYERQILLPEIGEAGQTKLQSARIILIGTGGLASSCAFYLTAAGIGTIGLVDDDKVERSNLNRQILHTAAQIGNLKVDSAQKTLKQLSSFVDIVTYPKRLETSDSLIEVIRDYNAVIDCSDNFPTRYAINDACIEADRPWVHGGIYGFEGQVTTFLPGRGPCYRCLYPSASAPSGKSQSAPVIGITPGMIGIVQAAEAIKLILGIGRPLVGRLLFIDLLEMSVSEFGVQRNATCPSCKEHSA